MMWPLDPAWAALAACQTPGSGHTQATPGFILHHPDTHTNDSGTLLTIEHSTSSGTTRNEYIVNGGSQDLLPNDCRLAIERAPQRIQNPACTQRTTNTKRSDGITTARNLHTPPTQSL